MSNSLNPARKSFLLTPILSLEAETQMQIRDIRNEDTVRRWMYTDHEIGREEHLAWLAALEADDQQLVFAVIDEARRPLGAVSLAAWSHLHRRTDWAYYLTKDARNGLGAALELVFIDFVFAELGVDKLNCEVLEGNEPVLKLHRKFLFEEEGFRRSNVLKSGSRVGVHCLGLTKDCWLSGRDQVERKYRRIFDQFSISFSDLPARLRTGRD